jgi:DHA3 family multidrug efflux protein-like MFS transporter
LKLAVTKRPISESCLSASGAYRPLRADRDHVEQAASPLAAFLIGPLNQFIVIRFTNDVSGARSIGGWLGTGPDRGIALFFTVVGLVGVLMAIAALRSPFSRLLSERYLDGEASIQP